MATIHLKGPGLNNYFAEQLVRDEGPEAARKKTCGPMREAVERVIAQKQQEQAAPCPNGECSDKTQCWEPCGDLGKSEEHAVVTGQS